MDLWDDSPTRIAFEGMKLLWGDPEREAVRKCWMRCNDSWYNEFQLGINWRGVFATMGQRFLVEGATGDDLLDMKCDACKNLRKKRRRVLQEHENS